MKSQNTKNTSTVDDAELLKTTISLLKRTMASEHYLYTFAEKTGYSFFSPIDPEEQTVKDMFNLGHLPLMTICNLCNIFGIDPFQIPEQPLVLPGNCTPGQYLAPFLEELGDHALIVRRWSNSIVQDHDIEAEDIDVCECEEDEIDEDGKCYDPNCYACTFIRISDDDRAKMKDAVTELNLLIKEIVAHQTLCQTSAGTSRTT
jgi:hypothetical protein